MLKTDNLVLGVVPKEADDHLSDMCPGQNQAGAQLPEGVHQTCAKVSRIYFCEDFQKIICKVSQNTFCKPPNIGWVAMLIGWNWWTKAIMYQHSTLPLSKTILDLASTWCPHSHLGKTGSMTRWFWNNFFNYQSNNGLNCKMGDVEIGILQMADFTFSWRWPIQRDQGCDVCKTSCRWFPSWDNFGFIGLEENLI